MVERSFSRRSFANPKALLDFRKNLLALFKKNEAQEYRPGAMVHCVEEFSKIPGFGNLKMDEFLPAIGIEGELACTPAEGVSLASRLRDSTLEAVFLSLSRKFGFEAGWGSRAGKGLFWADLGELKPVQRLEAIQSALAEWGLASQVKVARTASGFSLGGFAEVDFQPLDMDLDGQNPRRFYLIFKDRRSFEERIIPCLSTLWASPGQVFLRLKIGQEQASLLHGALADLIQKPHVSFSGTVISSLEDHLGAGVPFEQIVLTWEHPRKKISSEENAGGNLVAGMDAHGVFARLGTLYLPEDKTRLAIQALWAQP